MKVEGRLEEALRGGRVRPITNLIIYEDDLSRILACLNTLNRKARSRAALLIDKSGQLIASAGETDGLDTTSLGSLAAGHVAAASALAQLLGDEEFIFVFHEGEHNHLHFSVIGGRLILMVVGDLGSPVGLVRLQAKKISRDIGEIFEELERRPEGALGEGSLLPNLGLGDLTDDDFERLFHRR
jgi:predicted regulator of Ras-like GTPase activity (Roadblock/LC7/MglB family)